MKKLIAAVAAVVAAAGVQAAVITQTAPLALATTEINQPFTFNLFDTSLGTLTDVKLTFGGQAVSSASLTNTAAQDQDFTFGSNIRLRLAGTGLGNTDLNLSLFNYDDTILVGATANLGTVDKTGSVIASPLLSSFAGPGSATFTCRSLVQNTQAGGGGNITVTQSTTAGCGLSLVYTYDPVPVTAVPEPTSLALVGLALAGLGYASRRKA